MNPPPLKRAVLPPTIVPSRHRTATEAWSVRSGTLLVGLAATRREARGAGDDDERGECAGLEVHGPSLAR